MADRLNRVPFDSRVFIEDLRQTASLISAPFDSEVVRKVVAVFQEDLARCAVQLKTSSDPLDGLYFRFFSVGPDNLIDRADRHGLRRHRPNQLDLFQARLMEVYPHAAQAGLDFHCAAGLAKLWTFGYRPMDELTELSFMPESVRRHQAFFANHGLKECFCLSVDYRHSTINIYTFLDPVHRTLSWLEQMLAYTGSTDTEAIVPKALINALRADAFVGMTFSWDNPAMHRWALYGVDVRYLDAAACRTLPPLPPRLRTFVDASPTLSYDPHLNVAWSFEPTRCVVKFEKAYQCTPENSPVRLRGKQVPITVPVRTSVGRPDAGGFICISFSGGAADAP